MKKLINKNVSSIEMSGIRKIANRIDSDPNVVNLTFGQPNFNTPEYIKEAGIKAINDNYGGYTETAGLLELREEASRYFKKNYNLTYDAETEILITTGASEALDVAFRTILEPGSEVIIPAPVYPGYEPLIKMCEGISVLVDTSKTEFKITPEQIKENITDKTRCLVLPYPNNPMGSLLSESEIREIAEILKDKDIFVIADEIYSELNYDSKHFSIGSISEMKEKSIIINGLSKSHAMTGWRIGFLFAPSYLQDEFYKIHSFNTVCANTIGQYAGLEALRQGAEHEDVVFMRKDYENRKNYVFNRLKDMNLDVKEPQGAFYIFPSIVSTGLSSAEFAEKLLDDESVAIIPGDSFTEYGEGFIRISYAQSLETLEKGLDGIQRLLNSLDKK